MGLNRRLCLAMSCVFLAVTPVYGAATPCQLQSIHIVESTLGIHHGSPTGDRIIGAFTALDPVLRLRVYAQLTFFRSSTLRRLADKLYSMFSQPGEVANFSEWINREVVSRNPDAQELIAWDKLEARRSLSLSDRDGNTSLKIAEAAVKVLQVEGSPQNDRAHALG